MENSFEDKNLKTQKYLGDKGLIILIAFISAFVPLSTDLYLPALPGMTENLNADISLINLTLTLFFVFYAVGALFWGPLSDKYGRKPILLTGLIMYTVSSASCALAGDVYQLIVFRIVQAVGSGAAVAIGAAMVKDSYDGRKREAVLAVVQTMAMIAPIVAPVIGAFILGFTSWRGAFWTLAAVGFIAAIGTAAMEETNCERYTGSILQSMGRLGVVLKNPGFTSLLITFTLISIPIMAYISASSYIYINGFALSEQAYSYFFALNALVQVIGPFLYIALSRRYKVNSLITYSFIAMSLSGLLICILGNLGPWAFVLTLLPASLAGSVMRPPTFNIMLEQQKKDTGAASSLINCVFMLLGSIGMVLISFDWKNRILLMGLMYLLISALSLVLWLVFSKKPYVKQVSYND